MDKSLIYLIPDWNENTELEEDRVFTLSKFFSKEGYQNKVLLTNPIPFLRYKLNGSGHTYNNIVRVFDVLQNIKTDMGHPLSLEDLALPPDVDKIYTPSATLLVQKEKVVGKVSYNDYGFMSKIRYLQSDGSFIDEVYDDRGFVSEKHYLNKKYEVYKIKYFNELGENSVSQIGKDLIIEKKGNNFLKDKYTSLDEAMREVLHYVMEESTHKQSDHDISIVTTTEKKIIQQTQGLAYKGKMIRIITDRLEEDREEAELIVDTRTRMSKNKVQNYIPIFLPQLNLGVSDSTAQMQIYCKISSIHPQEDKIVASMIQKVIKDEQLSLIFEIDDFKSMERAKFTQKLIIESYFEVSIDSTEYLKVEKYITAKREKQLFTQDVEAVRELQDSSDWSKYVGAVNANLRIDYIYQPDSAMIEDALNNARIYLDLEDKYNMLRHSKAISAGIPIISKHTSDFITDGKNGFTLKDSNDEKELEDFIDYFIYNLRNWNKALVHNVNIIEQHESDNIIRKWREIITKKHEEKN